MLSILLGFSYSFLPFIYILQLKIFEPESQIKIHLIIRIKALIKIHFDQANLEACVKSPCGNFS